MSLGRRRLARAGSLTTSGLLDLVTQLFGPGQVGPFRSVAGSANPLGDFPSGTTLQEFGLPNDFSIVPPGGPLLDLAAQRAGMFGFSDQGLARLDAIGNLLSGEPSLNLDPELREEFFQQAVVRPRLQQLEREILPGIAGRFLPGGQTGAAQAATSQAVRDVTRDLASIQTGFLRDDERLRAQLSENAFARQLQAVPLSLQDELRQVSVPAQIGGITRAIQGQQNQEQLLLGLLTNPIFDPRIPLFGALQGNQFLASQPGILGGLGSLGGITQQASELFP